MKLSRLWQPRNPAFWLMLAVNLLSTALAWIAREFVLMPWAAALLVMFAIGNAVIGLRLMWVLVREPAGRDSQAARQDHGT